MNEKLEFSHRLIAAIEAAGYKARPSVVEKHFNSRYWGRPVSFQAVRRWLKGESYPEQDKLVVLAEWLQVEPHELRFGVINPTVKEGNKPWYAGLSVEEYELIDTFLKLPATKKQVVREVILAFSEVSGVR